ncbi:MAG: hypothetical protein J3K34DRAFT_437456 [Monoraphidium minutum]|nr:MAG: hypothetical protein J3K34DRAFT_437456 [Monoraphidium minutum]
MARQARADARGPPGPQPLLSRAGSPGPAALSNPPQRQRHGRGRIARGRPLPAYSLWGEGGGGGPRAAAAAAASNNPGGACDLSGVKGAARTLGRAVLVRSRGAGPRRHACEGHAGMVIVIWKKGAQRRGRPPTCGYMGRQTKQGGEGSTPRAAAAPHKGACMQGWEGGRVAEVASVQAKQQYAHHRGTSTTTVQAPPRYKHRRSTSTAAGEALPRENAHGRNSKGLGRCAGGRHGKKGRTKGRGPCMV